MRGTIYQINTEHIDRDDYISVDTVSEGEMAGFGSLCETEEGKRSEIIRYLVERILPKGMFTIEADGETLVYQGGFEKWRKSYLDLIRVRTEAISEDNIMEWVGPAYQLQKAIVNPLDTSAYFVTESNRFGTAERSRDLMLLVGRLKEGARLFIGEILVYHT